MKRLAVVLLFILSLAAMALAEAMQDANAAYQAKQWDRVVILYRQITATQPKNGQAWYRLGRGLEETGKGDDAIAAYKQAISSDTGFAAVFANLRIAAVDASTGHDEDALKLLQTVADAGFSFPEQLSQEPRFASLQKNQRFQKIVEQVSVNQAPCKDPKAPEYRQLDFWVGEWNVFDRAGNPVGASSVKLILKDCVVYENWSGAMGSEGKSFNKYNAELKQWEQYWVDEGPARQFFTGHFADHAMHYVCDSFTPAGQPLKRRLTFFNLDPNTVRQFSEGSTDNGKTYSTEYDLIYRRKS